MAPPAARRDDDAWLGELAEVRERLARLETRAENAERASADRHGQVLAAVQGLQSRLESVEGRAWKLALALALGAGGAAGGAELVRNLIGG